MGIKIAITGHTKSLGKSLFETLKDQHHEVSGFSRSNGFDIKNPFQRQSIIEDVHDHDVFINLVHNYYHQSDLLYELHRSWQGKNKIIINISSSVVDNDNWALDDYEMMEYKIQKINLENFSKYLKKMNELPAVVIYTISELSITTDTKNIIEIINERIHKK